MFCSPGMNIPAFVHICNYFQNSMCTYHDVLVSHVYLQGPMYVYHMYTYQDLCPSIIYIYIYIYMYILTRTYVLGSFVYLPGPLSLDHLLTRTYVRESDSYQDFCPWIIHLLTRTDVLGSYVYLPGPMSLDYTSTCQDLCHWIVCIFARTHVLGLYIYLPGPMSLDHMYICQDPCPWIIHLLTRTLDYTYTYQDLCPWNLHILSRTYVLGSYVYLPGPISRKKKIDKLKTDECTEKEAYGETTVCRQVEMEVCRWWRQKDMTCR